MSKVMIASKTETITRIIACAVFRPVITHLELENRFLHLRVTYLPSNLHMNTHKLRSYVLRRIARARREGERVICLYGDCFPDIEAVCQQRHVVKVPGPHCYEMLLGSNRFNQLISQTAGTFFLEKDLILGFDEFCLRPLELYDREMRKCCFEHYQRFLYVRQPLDPDLKYQAAELAEFLELSLEVADADYSHLEQILTGLIQT